jgi:phosphohistidine phosphatase
MLLLIVRHADAGERDSAKYPDDALRPLSKRGRKIHADVSEALGARDLRPDVIASSPWKRAWQTAAIMADEFSGKKKMKAIPAPSLTADPDLDAIRTDLGAIDGLDCIALVGHEPWLGELGSLLLTGDPRRMAIDLPKSGVIGIELAALEAGTGTLRFMLRPKLL